MDIVTYGHYGFALLMLPTATADHLEYERFNLIEELRPFIGDGKVKVFCINSLNKESWLHPTLKPNLKAKRHKDYNRYVFEEVIPYVKHLTSSDTPIITCGASLGAYHAVNLFFQRPDLIDGVMAMSGVYDLTYYSEGFWNEDVYCNSPIHFIADQSEQGINLYRECDHIHILAGQGEHEDPEASIDFSSVLKKRDIPHELDLWGSDMRHDWPTWCMMLPHYLRTRF